MESCEGSQSCGWGQISRGEIAQAARFKRRSSRVDWESYLREENRSLKKTSTQGRVRGESKRRGGHRVGAVLTEIKRERGGI